MKTSPHRLRAAFAAVLLIAALGTAQAEPAASALQAQAELWLRQGFDRPDAALTAIDQALAAPGREAADRRILQRTRGTVAARAGRDAVVEAALAALDALGAQGDALARPDADLVRALQSERRGRSVQAVGQAQQAADAYAAVCASGRTVRDDCDLRAQWLAQHLVLRGEASQADPALALTRSDEALALARRADDAALQAWSLAAQARLWSAKGDALRARQVLARADALLRDAARPDIEVQVALQRLRMAVAEEDAAAADRALATAFAAARRAESPRQVALVQANQSDILTRRGRAAAALDAVQAALPVARRFDDQRVERVLLHNGALALIALGRVKEARAQADRMFELWATEGTLGEQSIALREVADALAAAGDARAALDLFHREQAVTTRLMEAQREAAERSVRARFDRDAQQRSIDLMGRDNAVQAAELQNRGLAQQLWAMAAGVVTLAALLVGLLLRRVRATQAALQRSQTELKVQSERDPLTGVANRRHAQQRFAAESEATDGAWSGALLLVDVDHFKRVNDDHGHGAGDQVLIEVARRLQSALREQDVVVRWGGEEFLVLAPKARGAALDALARRLMDSVGASPIALAEGRAIAVSVSIGYGAFPIAPREQPIGWERALNLADMALYTAKSQGRHRAVGVAALADDEHALVEAERDFERAWSRGRVDLVVEAGA